MLLQLAMAQVFNPTRVGALHEPALTHERVLRHDIAVRGEVLLAEWTVDGPLLAAGLLVVQDPLSRDTLGAVGALQPAVRAPR